MTAEYTPAAAEIAKLIVISTGINMNAAVCVFVYLLLFMADLDFLLPVSAWPQDKNFVTLRKEKKTV